MVSLSLKATGKIVLCQATNSECACLQVCRMSEGAVAILKQTSSKRKAGSVGKLRGDT